MSDSPTSPNMVKDYSEGHGQIVDAYCSLLFLAKVLNVDGTLEINSDEKIGVTNLLKLLSDQVGKGIFYLMPSPFELEKAVKEAKHD